MNNIPFERRQFLKSSTLGILGITAFGYSSGAKTFHNSMSGNSSADPIFYRYPATDDATASGIVGASHANIDKVKELLSRKPELAVATWDWGFGDFETALGAASHVGRRDIAELLMSYGARADIFTFTMLGMVKSVQEIIEAIPGIQTHAGPHGITLLAHARNRLEDKNISAADRSNVIKVMTYLESLGNADPKPKSLEATDQEKEKYIGEYRFGEAEGDVFVVNLNSRKSLQLGRKGSSGIRLNKVDENTFSPPRGLSVKVIFKMKDDKATSLSIHEPEPLVTAARV